MIYFAMATCFAVATCFAMAAWEEKLKDFLDIVDWYHPRVKFTSKYYIENRLIF